MTTDARRADARHRATKETTIDADARRSTARAASRSRPGCRSSTTWWSSWAGTPRFDLTVHAEGDLHVDAHHTVEDVGIVLGGCLAEALGDKAGIRRFASMLLPLDEALIEVALDLSGPALPGLRRSSSRPDTPGLGTPPFDPQLAEEFWRAFATAGQPDPAHPAPSRARTRTTCSRPASRAWPAACATRCGSRGVASPRPRAACDRSGPRIAVLDYGIGNLRSAEKALQHVGAAARLVTDAAEVEAADAVVLPGVGAFGACARALRESGLEEPARCGHRGRRAVLRRVRRLPAPLRGLGGEPRARRAWASSPARSRPLPPGVKHPQMQWNTLRGARRRTSRHPLRGLGPRPVGLLRALVRAAGRGPRRWRCATTAGRGRAGRPRHAVGGPVPPGEVGATGLALLAELRRAWPAAAA